MFLGTHLLSCSFANRYSLMKITYFGHSAFQVETNDTTILIDPFITGNSRAQGVVQTDDLNPDVILLTHAHGDHWGDTPSIATRTGALVVATYEIIQYLANNHDHTNGSPMNTGGSVTFDWGTVRLTNARHSSSFPDGTYGGSANGIILEAEGKCIYHLGDTSLFSEMAWIGDDYAIDVAMIPIGDRFTMGPKDAVRAAQMIKPKLSVPVHYNTFPLIEVDPEAWAADMEAAGLGARVMAPGDTLEV